MGSLLHNLPPRRVLMTADAVGGVWTYALELARGLSSRGVEVMLAVMGGGVTAAKRWEAEQIRGLRLEQNEAKLEWMEEPWADVDRAGDWLMGLASGFDPDVIHLNGFVHAALAWNRPTVVVAHSCVRSWFTAVRGEEAPASWDTYTERVTRGLHAADLVIAPSLAILRELRRQYGFMANARVIYNGRDSALFHQGAKENLILSAGRLWDEAKNLRVLAAVAPEIEWPVYVAGESQHPDGGMALFSELRALGNLNPTEMAQWYSRAAIYALPALYEPFGLTVLEAALSGCALMLSDIPSLREIWGDAALYAAPNDPAAWRDGLNALAAGATKRSKSAYAAHKRALELNSTTMLYDYLEAYEQARHNRSCASHSSVIPFDLTGITETPISSAA